MVKSIYKSIFDFSKTKPVRLWALSLLASFLASVSFVMGGSVLLIGSAISILFSTAILMMSYSAIKGKAYHIENLFDYFKDFKQALHIIGGTLYASLFVLLWSLIPIVGPFIGIVKYYEYSLVPFILVNEPDIPAMDARLVSSMRTNGHKTDMFLADVVWVAICVVALAIVFSFCRIPFIGWIFYIVFIPGSVIFCSLQPVIANLIRAEFYSRLPDSYCTGKAKDFSDELFSEEPETVYADVVEPDIEVEVVEMPVEEEVISDVISALVTEQEPQVKKKAPAKKSATSRTTRKTTAKKSTARKSTRSTARKPAVKKARAEDIKSEE